MDTGDCHVIVKHGRNIAVPATTHLPPRANYFIKLPYGNLVKNFTFVNLCFADIGVVQ